MSATSTSGRVAVVIPTYDERENIVLITARVRAAVPHAHLLVVDDDSPDGTGLIADDLAAIDGHVHVLHRKGKGGLGTAYVDGFRWALERGFDVVGEMDADGSHRPEDLPRLLAALRGADVVLGSRWVAGGQVRNWPRSRRLLSRAGNTYARLVLGLAPEDVTGGYRVYRASALRAIGLDEVRSQGYCFQIDLVRRIAHAGLRIAEVPITFTDRTLGASKMSGAVVAEALWRVTRWAVSERLPEAGATDAHRAPDVVDDGWAGSGREVA